ncbi:DNA-binding response regulator, OmpR family, contains REC and winged-helix (wHTH) domain [Sporobacter termitidis DSM 10068]|uniref:Stage 0 sporulation protein A homolog n=1 Tax=Sporobacter termitidis DSM 10068 TaxID=1123282 RepID=A0A1M5Z1T6_9FIRM|nr:response regulator transcription factor [Sporobacter termitidis]SHI18190.1 DNA-binding response regulator, OmpR family, contains REC and winged-helix (wHTH) domain [Sporobacter termitidis DSM 10068]
MTQGKTVLVVDDEAKITEVVSSYLERSGYTAIRAHSGGDALRRFNERSPALVILDLMLPDMTGEEVCRELRKNSAVPIIMLTAKVEDADVVGGLSIGADDYVTKPFSPRQLIARVEAVLRRAPAPPPLETYELYGGEVVIDARTREVLKAGAPVPLTPNEFGILLTLAKYPKKTFTRAELIELALGEDFDGYDRVIDTHIKNIRQKLGDGGRSPRYLLTVHGVGYKIGGAG